MEGAEGGTRSAGETGSQRAPESLVLWAGRAIGAGLLVWMGWIHLHLWSEGYKHIATVGPLFMANFVVSVAAALLVLAVPTRRLVAAATAGGACLALGTLAGLAVSINIGLFGFTESWNAPFAHLSVVAEITAAAVLLATSAIGLAGRHR